MNIYFACSITGGREFESIYQTITKALAVDCHEVPTAHLAETGITALEAAIEPLDVYTRDVTWIHASDALIAEVSAPSHGVGYEIGYALGLGKPVLALFEQGRKVSKMITGNPDPNLSVKTYQSPQEAVHFVREFLANNFIREKHH
ncbi:MAG TPA: nucleoside 2-deoxyribosyltransferase [Anaerolineales bacterium]|nr:nucleoside 2-deoxyribosyltransferase [Anaerolineales bacterium]